MTRHQREDTKTDPWHEVSNILNIIQTTRFKPLLKKKVGRLPLIFVQSSFRGSHEAESGLSGVSRSCGFSGACLQICNCGGLKSVFFACYTITTMQQQVYVGCHTLDSWRSRQPLPLLDLLQRAQKFAVPCKNTASKEQSPLNFSWAVHSVS